MKTQFSGIITALVTPFHQGEVDFESLKKLVRHQLSEGVDGLVINGTTAESPTLTATEVREIFSTVRAEVGKKTPLILGTGLNSTAKTIQSTKEAKVLGADAALVVVPYYNKPPQRGLVAHFTAVAENAEVPIILYNVPGRTITSLSPESIGELSQVPNIIGIKEATGDMLFAREVFKKIRKDFFVSSGDDATFLDLVNLGGCGVISVVSNLFVKDLKTMFEEIRTGRASALEGFKKYQRLLGVLYIESNPIPVKWALYKMGIIQSPEMRLPLVSLDKKYHEEMTTCLNEAGLL